MLEQLRALYVLLLLPFRMSYYQHQDIRKHGTTPNVLSYVHTSLANAYLTVQFQ